MTPDDINAMVRTLRMAVIPLKGAQRFLSSSKCAPFDPPGIANCIRVIEMAIDVLPSLADHIAQLQSDIAFEKASNKLLLEQIDGKPSEKAIKSPVPDDAFVIENVSVIKATAKALLFRTAGPGIGTWIPLECVHDDSEVWRAGDRGTMLVKRWYVEKQGWTEADEDDQS